MAVLIPLLMQIESSSKHDLSLIALGPPVIDLRLGIPADTFFQVTSYRTYPSQG